MRLLAPAFWLLPTLLGLARAQDDNRPPFPEVWDPYPLRFPYAADESLYLTPARPSPSGPAVFALPKAARRPLRVLIRDRLTALDVTAPAGTRLMLRRSDGSAGPGPELSGRLHVVYREGNFRVSGPSGRPFSTGPATALRFVAPRAGPPLQADGKSYRGNLELYPAAGGMECVNALALEDYLRGVVPLEMGHPDSAALSALEAQAIVARTYALKRMLAGRRPDFDVRASVQDQVFGGAEAESPLGDRAVTATAGRVVLYGDTLALCYYYSTCGGITAARNEVWGGPAIPYLVSQPDRDSLGRPWCRASPYMHWTQSWDAQALAGILRANLASAGVDNPPSFRRITGLQILGRFSDGRIRTLRVQTDGGPIDLHGDKIRFALRPGPGTGRILASDRFDIALNGDHVVAQGSGFGHGIGMCQMGALGRAAAGQNAEQILAAYYPGTHLAAIK